MTIWRSVDQLNRHLYPATAAENIDVFGSYKAVDERAHWEAGYTAAILNMPHNGRMFDLLVWYEAAITRQQQRISELTAELEKERQRVSTLEGLVTSWIAANAAYAAANWLNYGEYWEQADKGLEQAERALFTAVGKEYGVDTQDGRDAAITAYGMEKE